MTKSPFTTKVRRNPLWILAHRERTRDERPYSREQKTVPGLSLGGIRPLSCVILPRYPSQTRLTFFVPGIRSEWAAYR